jgi:hypothetical protein
LRLSGQTDEHVQEAAAVAQQVVGFSAYLASIGYDVAQFRRELEQAVAFIKKQQGT